MLENLLVAVESETQTMDVTRVSGFMQKVRAIVDSQLFYPVLKIVVQVNGAT